VKIICLPWMKDFLPIKDWAEDEKPREKLIKKGKSALSNAELLALLLSTGTIKRSALDLARDVLSRFNNDLNELAKANIKDLCKIGGIGEAKAVCISAAIEFASRRQIQENPIKGYVGSSKTAYQHIRSLLEDLNHEEFWIMTLNRKNCVIGKYKISEGGLTSTVVDQRKIFKIAIDDKSTGIIMFHNHPSGNQSPSEADNQLTRKLKDGGKILDINVLDHIIIVQSGYYSYADEGTL
jgi:DNA repair protein RadC